MDVCSVECVSQWLQITPNKFGRPYKLNTIGQITRDIRRYLDSDEESITDYLGLYAEDHDPNTTSVVYSRLRVFQRHLEQFHGIPMETVPIYRYEDRDQDFPSREVVEKLIRSLDKSLFGLRTACAIRLLWDTGCRASELLKIPVGNAPENIWEPITMPGGNKSAANRRRTIVLQDEETGRATLRWLAVHPYRTNPKAPLFVAFQGHGGMSYGALWRSLDETSRKAGLGHLRAHQLRHLHIHEAP